MRFSLLYQWGRLALAAALLLGCAANRAELRHAGDEMLQPPNAPNEAQVAASPPVRAPESSVPSGTAARRGAPDMSWTYRPITLDETYELNRKDPDVTPSDAWEILARLNVRARYYVIDDIKAGHPLKVPKDFSAYKDWTPLPKRIPELAGLSKFILIVKDVPFLGWYQNGKLLGDTFICIGRNQGWTRAGLYRVENKDADHISRSYPNAFGQPAPMPWALRIYETVWIHAGDITEGYCSHGCINLPLKTAQWLFNWADAGTAVMVLNSMDDLEPTLAKNHGSCTLYAQNCAGR